MVHLLKSLLVLAINISFGFVISYNLYFLFFYPRKIKIFGKYDLYLTPGYFYRKKEKLLSIINNTINDYYNCLKQDWRVKNFLTEYEDIVFEKVFQYIKKLILREWMPDIINKRIENISKDITKKLIRTFSRDILPQFLDEWQIYTKIEILDLKLDVKQLEILFKQYIYKYFLYFNLFFFTIVGLMNMILFLILS